MATRITRSNNSRKLSPASSTTLPPETATSKPQALTSRQDSPVLAGQRKSSLGKAQNVLCTCRQPNDKTPMIKCDLCAEWFHFFCIQLSERDAEDIEVYICDACHDKTKLSTVYEWEGPETVQTVQRALADAKSRDTKAVASYRRTRSASALPPDSPDDDDADDDVASGDDYKDEENKEVKSRRKGANRIASSDEEDEDSNDEPYRLKRKRGKKDTQQQRKRPRKTATPAASDDGENPEGLRRLKRKSQPKNQPDLALDATRKYCLVKLQEVVTPMFLEFSRHTTDDEATKELLELDENEKRAAEERASNYSQELETCLHDVYGEFDKNGIKVAAGKYKDRFRMLTFNLSQKDRYDLRKSIGTDSLPAIELSKMTSVDLANEQIKQKVEAANRESLQHSILTERPTLPRAKITHKGEEVIEDIEGFDIGKRLREEEFLERERERERAIRERAAKAMTISPVSPVRTSFGPQDILAQQHTSQLAAQALAEQTASLAQATTTVDALSEPSFKFDDLIAIDLPDSPNSEPLESSKTGEISINDEKTSGKLSVEIPGEQQESMSSNATFDLKNVWSANESTPQESSGSPKPDDGTDLPQVDIDLGTTTHDEDFDMFLGESEPPPTLATLPNKPELEGTTFEKLPIIWNGSIFMPDSEQCPKVHARQVAGRPTDSNSSQWGILFPSHQLRIEGRVAVNDSAKYITQNRLNVSRELIVVALTPTDERKQFDELLSILISRGRHAVIHPWGSRPSPDAPGKELYLVPVISNQPLPDYVELLDLVHFPKQSDENRLLGVFILNKGKFPIPAYSQPPLSSQSPTVPSLLTDLMTTYPPPLALSMPPTIPIANQNSSPNPDLVSKLSSEQIESLLQTVLASNNGVFPTSLPALTPTIPTSTLTPLTTLPPTIANLLQQSHHSFTPNHPSASYPYPQVQQGSDHPHLHPNSYAFESHKDPTSERDKSPYSGYNDRSERARGRSRGFARTRDSGWAGRAKARGRGGGSRGWS